MTTCTTHRPLGILPGDRVTLSTDSNRMRRVVAGIGATESATTFRMLLFVRPSRGFAKHIRRQKAAGIFATRRPWPPAERTPDR